MISAANTPVSLRRRALGPLLAILFAAVFANIFLRSPLLTNAAGVGFCLYLLLSAPDLRRVTLIVVAAVTTAIAVLLLFEGRFDRIWPGILQALIFVGFLPANHLLRATIESLPELARSRTAFQGMTRSEQLGGIELSSHLLGSVLVLGSLIIVRPLLPPGAEEREREAAANAAMRGLSLVIFWSPFSVGMAFILAHFPAVPLWQVLVIGMPIGAAGIILSFLLFSGTGLREAWRGLVAGRVFTQTFAMFEPILLPLVGVIAAVLAASSFTNLTTIEAVILVLPPYCVAWLLFRLPAAVRTVTGTINRQLGLFGNDLAVFAAAMTLGQVLDGSALIASGIQAVMPAGLPTMTGLFIGIVLGFLLALAGAHAIIIGSIMVGVLPQLAPGADPLAALFVLLFGWFCGSLSITSLQMLVASSLFEVRIDRLAMWHKLPFALTMGAMLVAIVAALQHLF